MAPRKKSALLIGSEAVPFAKTGGLADVLGALPPALARLGWDVTLAIPRYRGVTAGSLVDSFSVTVGGFSSKNCLMYWNFTVSLPTLRTRTTSVTVSP